MRRAQELCKEEPLKLPLLMALEFGKDQIRENYLRNGDYSQCIMNFFETQEKHDKRRWHKQNRRNEMGYADQTELQRRYDQFKATIKFNQMVRAQEAYDETHSGKEGS